MYEVGSTDSETRGSPLKPTPSVHYFEPAPNQIGEESLLPERELDNPIYGEDETTDNMYTVPSKQQKERSPADHEFDNPIYGIEDRNTYEVPYDTNLI